MTTVNTLFSGNAYQLADQNGAANTAASGSSGTSLAASLNTQAKGNNAAQSYLLNLSPEAQSYLAGLTSATGSSSESKSTDESFLLTRQQQAKIGEILAKYKNEPFTQETYEALQADLSEAGLSADTLAAKEKVRSINPTQTLLNLLNGGSNDPLADTSASDELLQQKADNYMAKIRKQWEAISTTAAAPASEDDATTVSA